MGGDAGLSVIPDDLSALSNLQLLELDNCKSIKHIPSCLAFLKSLRELSLNDTTGLSHVDSINHLKLNKLSLRLVFVGSGLGHVWHNTAMSSSLVFVSTASDICRLASSGLLLDNAIFAPLVSSHLSVCVSVNDNVCVSERYRDQLLGYRAGQSANNIRLHTPPPPPTPASHYGNCFVQEVWRAPCWLCWI